MPLLCAWLLSFLRSHNEHARRRWTHVFRCVSAYCDGFALRMLTPEFARNSLKAEKRERMKLFSWSQVMTSLPLIAFISSPKTFSPFLRSFKMIILLIPSLSFCSSRLVEVDGVRKLRCMIIDACRWSSWLRRLFLSVICLDSFAEESVVASELMATICFLPLSLLRSLR